MKAAPPTNERGGPPARVAAPWQLNRAEPATISTRFQAENTAAGSGGCQCAALPFLPKDSMRFLMPADLIPLVPEWGKGERPARIAYVADQISTRRYDENRDYVAIHSPTIKRIISAVAWQSARENLAPYTEIDHDYIKDDHSKGYRWVDELRNQDCASYIIRCPIFIRHMDSVVKKHLGKLGSTEQRVARDLLLLVCTIIQLPSRGATGIR